MFPEFDGFICPICLIQYRGVQANSHLSSAHIWPKALGGKLATVICKRCNNSIGTKYEAHLIESKKATSARRLGRKRERLIVKGETLMANVEAVFIDNSQDENANWKIIYDDTKCDSQSRENFHKIMSNQDGAVKLEFTHHHPKHKLSDIALLSCAFLSMFKHFGYEFVFTELGVSMSNAIWHGNIEKKILIQSLSLPQSNLLVPWIASDQSQGFGFAIPISQSAGINEYFILPPLGKQYHEFDCDTFSGGVEVIARFIENIDATKTTCPVWRQFYKKSMFKAPLPRFTNG